jgi:hypothetical protein
MEEARRVAEAHLDLRRVRKFRDEALQRALSAEIYLRPRHRIRAYLLAMKSEEVGLTDRELDRINAIARLREPSTEQHEIQVVIGLEEELKSIDRYERRARSRRKFAIRDMDRARLNKSKLSHNPA